VATYDPNAVYVSDTGNDRILKLATDPTTKATTQTILPFAGLKNPLGVAVDGAGNVFVVDSGNNRVLKLGSDFTKG
jgi:DNA-binding beta-propeller fold protein YncE